MCLRTKVYDCQGGDGLPGGGGLRVSLLRKRYDTGYSYIFTVHDFYVGNPEAFVYKIGNGAKTIPLRFEKVKIRNGYEQVLNLEFASNMHYLVYAEYQKKNMVFERGEVFKRCNDCQNSELRRII